jgi:periplasmic protein CpxP/Spy
MFIRKPALPALALAAVLAGAGLTTLGAPQAQAQTAAPAAGHDGHDRGQHIDPSRFVEGRIAFLKAVLKITPAQEAGFERVAEAMRANAKDMAQVRQQFQADRDKPKSAVERLEERVKFGELHTRHQQRFLAAFKPLYDSLSADQKKTADELLAARHHHHMR